jgi:CRP-like cAMP-binding protein
VRLRREDIAELVGCIPETAIRVLADFSRRGILRTGWKRIALMDRSALERLTLSPHFNKSAHR